MLSENSEWQRFGCVQARRFRALLAGLLVGARRGDLQYSLGLLVFFFFLCVFMHVAGAMVVMSGQHYVSRVSPLGAAALAVLRQGSWCSLGDLPLQHVRHGWRRKSQPLGSGDCSASTSDQKSSNPNLCMTSWSIHASSLDSALFQGADHVYWSGPWAPVLQKLQRWKEPHI